MNNPYSLTFGKEPIRIISRERDIRDMTDVFCSEMPSTMLYIITGVRGSGKTVTMAAIADRLRNESNWIVVTLNPNRDLLSSLAANLYEHPLLKGAFISADITLSFGIGANIRTDGPAADVEVQLKKMLKIIKDQNKRVLIAIDEATNNKNFRVFASAFQMFIIEKYPVFLIMTGLYNNIHSLQNEKNLTFLYRAPKYMLQPLNVIAMSNNYREMLGIPQEEADEMARMTKGYSYAFQVLGYLKYENPRKSISELISLFDESLEEYSYEKIWSELSKREKDVISILVNTKDGKMRVKEIKEKTGLTDQSFPTYRKRLSGSGVVNISEYGYCELALPRFKEIISRSYLNSL